ncbi:hypothetical protein [Streptomyces sp. NPDC052036]|uniref:hypothetical protein n=1 Tax=unclassified Streptomyces TaxID=2593676 RepID=UPI0034444824
MTRPAYPPPPAKPKSGCVPGCVVVLLLLGVLTFLTRGCGNLFESGASPTPDSSAATSSTACPGRIAGQLPRGDGAVLVAAFHTAHHQITLCRTRAGSLYYFGEFLDRRAKGIAMKAERTSDGYEARNGVYRYEIHDGVVTVYRSGTQIDEEHVTPEPSPS